jgi:hypothetical protein
MHQHIELHLLNNSTNSSAAIKISAHSALLKMATMQWLREKHELIAFPALATRATPQTESLVQAALINKQSSSPKEECEFVPFLTCAPVVRVGCAQCKAAVQRRYS